MTELRKNWVVFGAFWVLFTLIGEYLALGLDLLPARYSDTAEVVDEAYVLLIALAVPVFAMVAAVMATSAVRFMVRGPSQGPPTEDGPHLATHRRLLTVWVVLTSLLALGLAVDPGFVGLRDLRGESSADLVVKVEAQRWSWRFVYPGGGVSTTELVLPVDERVRFDLTSIDILHSFWVPGFRVKLDMVPGRVTTVYLTPERLGSYDNDSNLRVQCAELCGLDHSKMSVPVRVLEASEFETWAQGLQKGS